jgi:hypothetical protein
MCAEHVLEPRLLSHYLHRHLEAASLSQCYFVSQTVNQIDRKSQ